MSAEIRTRFLVLSDTHSYDPKSEGATSYAYRWPLPQADVAIHTGDLTMNGLIEQHEKAIGLLKNLRADLKIVIPGNHDLTLDSSYYTTKGHLHGPRTKYNDKQLQYIRELYTGPEAKAANIVYLEEGTHTFRLKNNARLTIYASAYTPEFCDWAFAYPRDQDRFNLADAENPVTSYRSGAETNIDVMLTHGPPFGILDTVKNRFGGGDSYVGCEHLFHAVERARPLLHCFGHIHEGWGSIYKRWPSNSESNKTLSPAAAAKAGCFPVPVNKAQMVQDMGSSIDMTELERGSGTLFVNSSIMTLQYNPNQAPWLIDLMLSLAT